MRSYFDTEVTQTDIDRVIYNLRQSDIDEMWAADRFEPKDGVLKSVSVSELLWCFRVDKLAVALCGIASLGVKSARSWGVPWLLGTPELSLAPVGFFRGSRGIVQKMQERYPNLMNFVDARNTLSLRWLKWLGFQIGDAEAYGPDQLPFHRIFKGVRVCAQQD